MRLSIGDLGRRTGATVQTIRYYEKLGLMPPPFRTQATQRVYDETDIQRMTFIRHGRALAFSLQDMVELVALDTTADTVCAPAHKILNKKIKYVRQNIEKLTLILQDLERMKTGCSLRNQKCYVMQSLESHAYCISEHS